MASILSKPPVQAQVIDPKSLLLSREWVLWFAGLAGTDLTPYQLRSEKDANGGYAGLDGTGLLKIAEFPNIPAALILAGALANGMTGTTQAANDNSTKLATTAYLDRLINAASGIAGLDANSRIALAALPFKIGWVLWKDVAGTITIIGTGGNITLTVGFSAGGSPAGLYQVTSGTAFASANWILAGIGDEASYIIQRDTGTPLHNTTQLNFKMATVAALARPTTESLLVAIGPA